MSHHAGLQWDVMFSVSPWQKDRTAHSGTKYPAGLCSQAMIALGFTTRKHEELCGIIVPIGQEIQL